MRSPKLLALPRRAASATKRLQDYLRVQFPATVGNIKLAEHIHAVWKEGFDDGVAMQQHGERVFGKRKLAMMRKEVDAK